MNIAATPGPRGGSPSGRWPANVILDESQAEVLDDQHGAIAAADVSGLGALATQSTVSLSTQATGTLQAAHRKLLFREYMDAICNGPDFQLAPTDFIARGQGGAGLFEIY